MSAAVEREQRVRRHVAYTYLLGECLKRDPKTGLYLCPSRTWKLICMHEMERVFDYDLSDIPGFFYDVYRTEEMGGWMVNTPETGFIRPVMDERGRIAQLHVLTMSLDARPRLLTSKGLPLGS